MKNICVNCGKEYSRKPSKIGKYCNQKCYGEAKKGHTPWNKGLKTELAPWLGKRRSKETIEKIKKTKRLNPYSHPKEVREKIRESTEGVSKGGVSDLGVLIRGTETYKRWRTAIFERDNYTCIKCGARNGNGKAIKLNADHYPLRFVDLIRKFNVKSIKEAIKCADLWLLDLGRTLCLGCHKQTKSFGRQKVKIGATE
jgi:hypothetical protein